MIELRFAVYSLPELLKVKITKIVHICKPDTAKALCFFSFFSSFFSSFVASFLLELCTVAKLKILDVKMYCVIAQALEKKWRDESGNRS